MRARGLRAAGLLLLLPVLAGCAAQTSGRRESPPPVLAALFRVFGEGPLAPRVFQILLGAATCLFVTWITFRLTARRRTAIVAGAIAALYGTFLYFEGELLIVTLFTFLVYLATGILDGFIGLGVITLVAFLALFLPSLAVAVRRLHDTDRSGLWILIGLVPFVGPIVLIVFYVLEGTAGSNRFGAPEAN